MVSARLWLRLIEAFVPAVIAVTLVLAWQADRRDRAQLAAQLAAAQRTISQATTTQKDRDAQLTQTLAQLAAQKQSNLTAAQLLQALPQALGLPQPITRSSPDQPAPDQNVGAGFSPSRGDAHTTAATVGTLTPTQSPKGNYPSSESLASSTDSGPGQPPDNPLPKSSPQTPGSNAVIPAADLKPLYDFALDCQACRAKLAAAQADLTDERTKSAALTKQRNEAVTAAKGGTVLRRVARAAKWFALGAIAGAAAAKAAH